MFVFRIGEGRVQLRFSPISWFKTVLVTVITLAGLLASSCGWPAIAPEARWMIGYWVRSYSYAPYSDLLEFADDGSRYRYEDYNGTVLIYTGTWSSDGDVLTLDGESAPIVKITDDNYLYKGFLYFRQGNEPGGSVFDQSATELTQGVWLPGSLALQSLQLFSFTAPSAGNYEIQWDDQFDGSGSTTSDIQVSAYKQDRSTSIFTEKDGGYDDPELVSLASVETIYIIVDAYYQEGTFRIAAQ
jgi:hypothetical protein